MMKSEFEMLAGRKVTSEQYDVIEALYMESELDKHEFVKSMKGILKSIPEIKKVKAIRRIVFVNRKSGQQLIEN